MKNNRKDSFATAAEKPPSSTSLGSTSTNGNNNNILKGFNGSRLRQLQLERARSSISVDEEESRQETLRKWQTSLNDNTADSEKISKPTVKPTSLSTGKAFTAQNSHRKGVAPQKVHASAGRFQHPDDPVGYVLPDLTKEELPTPMESSSLAQPRQQSSVDVFERHRMLNQLRKSTSKNQKKKNEWDLKYPHGMPRWGPTLVTTVTTSHDNKKKDTEKEEESAPRRKQTSPHNSVEEEASCTVASKSHTTLSAMEKAKAQSQRAAARAVQHIVAAHSDDNDDSGLPVHVYYKEDTMVGLGSRLLGRHNGKKLAPSLFQSARMQQSRIIDSPSRTTLHQTMSLDDPLHQSAVKQKEGTHSVHSFEYLNRNYLSRDENHSSTDSDEDSDEEEVIVFESNSSSSEDDEDDDEESQSWDMRTSSEGEKSASEAANSQSSHHSNPPRQSAVPFLVLSEVDQESCSMYSDYSSLAANMGKEAADREEEDEFFDSAQSIKATSSREERTFDSRRCRELLLKRNEYLQQEEVRKRLISPEALNRLAHIPSLKNVADGDALHEIASRGRWLLSKQAHEYKITIPAAQPPRLRPQPLATLPDNDDSDEVKPIPLVTPTAMSSPIGARKVLWHRPVDEEDDDNNQNQVSQKEESKITLRRFYRFALRCGTVMILLSWAARIYFSLQNLFLCQSDDIGKFAISNKRIGSLSATNFVCDGQCANLTFSFFLPGMTHVSMRDMPIKNGLPPVAETSNQQVITEDSTPSSNICEETTTDFWDIPNPSEHNVFRSDVSKPWESMFHAAMTRDQTICDLGICYLSLESPAPRHIENIESSDKDPEVIEGFTDKHLLNALGKVLRKSSQQVQENRNISEDSSFLRVLGDAVLKSNPHLTATNVASGDGNILNLLGDKLRKSSETLQEKRQRRREVYRV